MSWLEYTSKQKLANEIYHENKREKKTHALNVEAKALFKTEKQCKQKVTKKGLKYARKNL